jgi:ATP-dependent HslUV protease subunit HslV
MTIRGTTICAVRRDGVTAIAGDGQVTMGESVIMKNGAVKVRRVYNGQVVIGFAGSVADAFALSERLEAKLSQFAGNLKRAAVELALEWRTDKVMRQLQAMMICADKENLLVLDGAGNLIEPDDGILTIGSGGNYALAAAKAMMENTELSAPEIAKKALLIASSICVFTNDHITVEVV